MCHSTCFVTYLNRDFSLCFRDTFGPEVNVLEDFKKAEVADRARWP